jgi:hypothetical protein
LSLDAPLEIADPTIFAIDKVLPALTGERCRNWAIRGGAVCRYHGGATAHIKNNAHDRSSRRKKGSSALPVPPVGLEPTASLLVPRGATGCSRRCMRLLPDSGVTGRPLDSRSLVAPDLFGEQFGEGDHGVVVVAGADDLQTDRQAVGGESGWDGQGG